MSSIQLNIVICAFQTKVFGPYNSGPFSVSWSMSLTASFLVTAATQASANRRRTTGHALALTTRIDRQLPPHRRFTRSPTRVASPHPAAPMPAVEPAAGRSGRGQRRIGECRPNSRGTRDSRRHHRMMNEQRRTSTARRQLESGGWRMSQSGRNNASCSSSSSSSSHCIRSGVSHSNRNNGNDLTSVSSEGC
jgi:hypothetical protein